MNRGGPGGPGGPATILAVTMGEPAGIGGKLTIKAWRRQPDLAAPFVAIDDADRLSRLAAELDTGVPVRAVATPAEAAHVFAEALPVIDTPLAVPATPGNIDPANADTVLASIETAARLARAGEVGGLVTNPIHKRSLYAAGFQHPGHTEFLAKMAGPDVEPVMMLACEGLRTVPVTTHLSLKEALAALTPERIVSQARITADALARDCGLTGTRLAVAGLNPHAGEDGTMGDEEKDVIEPAIQALRAEGFAVTGPHSPDTLFSAFMRKTYEAAVCMYHDQALIPIKTPDFAGGVNITLGLPFVRTSPDHGTALDIAAKGVADETSLIAALRMAADIARHRAAAEA